MKALELLIYFRQLKRLSKKEAEGRGGRITGEDRSSGMK